MANLHLSFWEELEKLTQEHTLCYSISGQGFVGEEETRSTNEVGTVATMATDRMEDTPSHSSNMKNIVEDSGPGGCSSRLNNSPRKHQRRRKKELPKEGVEPAIGTSGKIFSNPEVNTESSETQNLPHHFPDQPTLAFVGYLAVKEEKPKHDTSEFDEWVAQVIRKTEKRDNNPPKVKPEEKRWPRDAYEQETKGNWEGDPIPKHWPLAKTRKKARTLETSRTKQKEIEGSIQQ